MIDNEEVYGTILPAYRGPALSFRPRHRAAFYEEDEFYPIPIVVQDQTAQGIFDHMVPSPER
jgi:hypothetical protein